MRHKRCKSLEEEDMKKLLAHNLVPLTLLLALTLHSHTIHEEKILYFPSTTIPVSFSLSVPLFILYPLIAHVLSFTCINPHTCGQILQIIISYDRVCYTYFSCLFILSFAFFSYATYRTQNPEFITSLSSLARIAQNMSWLCLWTSHMNIKELLTTFYQKFIILFLIFQFLTRDHP